MVVLVLAIGDDSPTTADTPQAAVRADGGPEEGNVVAAIGSRSTEAAAYDAKIAAAIRSGPEPASAAATRPDESATAAAISGPWARLPLVRDRLPSRSSFCGKAGVMPALLLCARSRNPALARGD